MPWQSVPLEESLPTCQKGDTLAVAEVKLLEKQTSPPDYLTEAELITLMEKHGIGGSRLGPPPRLGPTVARRAGQGRAAGGPWLRPPPPDLALGLEMCPWRYLHLQG